MTVTVRLRPAPADGVPPKTGEPVSHITEDTVDTARLLQLGVTAAEEREFLRQVEVDDVVAVYGDRDQNWADYRIRSVPDTIADDAASVSMWIAPLEHGAGLDIPVGACKVGFSRARTPLIDDSDIAAAEP